MTKSKFILPALILGVTLLGGTSAYAFGGGTFPVEAFKSFSAEKQTAIQKAWDIRATAEKDATAVLDRAGVTKDEVHTAMEAFHKQHKAAMDAALEANDFNAFKALIAQGPHADNADKLTADIFAKIVKIHALEKSGDKAGAQALRKEVRDAGLKGGIDMGGGMGHGGHGGKMYKSMMDQGGGADGQ